MGFYSRRIFPRLVNALMSAESFSRIRRDALAEVRGETLEIGFGSGLNLPHYPSSVGRLTAIDVNPGMLILAARRMARFPSGLEVRTLDSRSLPFDDETFDSVVSTWTLCSIPDVGRALREVYRVLRPNGRFFFVEHGLSAEPEIQKWQHRLTPFQKRLADGCHLDRNIPGLLGEAGFRLSRLESFYMEKVPRIGGFLYTGIATRA
jgi:ubiquinone/menaquinone biosynthesis C-methylase UbiE